MRRLATVVLAALLVLVVPSAGALAATVDNVGASTLRIAADVATGVCDVKASVGSGPLVDDVLVVHSSLIYSFDVHGFGFPPTTTLTIEFSKGGSISSTFYTVTDPAGAFLKGFSSWVIGSSPVQEQITVYDPAHKGTCIDFVTLLVLPPGWTSDVPFTDIKGHLFENDIIWLYDSGITKGCSLTLFCPDLAVTREQMAAFLDRALALPATSKDFFTDDESSMFEASINRLAAAGITTGCSATTFCPSDTVKRDQMASFLARAFALPATTTDSFTDDTGNIHEININRLAASGITSGCSATTYCPAGLVTRGQMAAFLHRALT